MRRPLTRPESGLTLLEVMVALVILSLVIAANLRLLQGGHRLMTDSRRWSDAVAYAVDGMERAKLAGTTVTPDASERLPNGFRRTTTVRPWGADLSLITVTVELPSGSRFDLNRLEREPRFRRTGAADGDRLFGEREEPR